MIRCRTRIDNSLGKTADEVLAGTPGRAEASEPPLFEDVESAPGALAPLVPMLLAAQAAGDMTMISPAYRRILAGSGFKSLATHP